MKRNNNELVTALKNMIEMAEFLGLENMEVFGPKATITLKAARKALGNARKSLATQEGGR